MRLRRRRTPPPPECGPNFFGIRSRLARSTGTDTRYKLGAIRALPTTKKETVILQATDGHQAVCLVTAGHMNSPRLIPSNVLPKRKEDEGVMVAQAGDQWRSSGGKSVPDKYAGESSSYPHVADVLPKFGPNDTRPPLQLGIDLTLLSKVAESLGTPKLTLLIPIPDTTQPVTGKKDGYVRKPVAVCPANDEGKVRGIGVVMPLQPVNGVPFYMKVRRLVAAAEARCKKTAAKTKPVRHPNAV